MSDVTTPRRDTPSPWLHAAVVGVPAASIAVIEFGDHASGAVLQASLASLVFVAAWLAFGRRTLNGAPGWIAFTAVIAVVAFVGTAASPGFASFQTIAYPLVWMAAPGVRRALPGNVAVALGTGVGYAFSTHSVIGSLIVQAASLVFSVGLGVWFSRIAHESNERQLILDRLTATQEQLAALARETGAAAERERLARELHDTIAQSLTGIVMLAERAKTRHPEDAALGVLEESAREALTETRGLVAATATVRLDDGLGTAIRNLAERFERETGVRVVTAVHADVPRSLEVMLLRCSQEGLANVRKHARATSVRLDVAADAAQATLTVTDDGVGFAEANLSSGFGLAGMRDRVALVGGEVALEHVPGGGTRLHVQLPTDHEAGAPAATR